ncbi:MAG: protease complex subunit PrcB family protein [Candidatus Thorarchaeota archaeon]
MERKVIAGAILLCTLIVGSVIVLQFSFAPSSIPFEEIEQGYYCGIKNRINYVINDLESWETLWTDMNNISTGVPDLPFVNFTYEVVFAVFIGEFATGGYIAEITHITASGNRLTVHIKEQHPGEGCGVTMAFSQPYHIVKASMNSTLSVEFEYSLVIHNCP